MQFCEVDQRTGRVIHTYTRGKLLGRGGFAHCYEATENDSGRIYAVKVVEKKALKPKTQAKLKSEIKIHGSLQHEHIVKFERFFEDANNVYILLELCTGQTLMDLQKRKRRLNDLEAQYLMMQTLLGVKYMHQNNIIHRDLKLGNLLLTDKMVVKIADFGLAAQLEFDGERKRTICGTPNYIAPEILDGGSHGHSFEVDTWSLGVILYTLLVGKPPFETNDVKATYRKIRNISYTFPADVHISPEAKNLIQRTLQSCPESRPTVNDLIADPYFTKFGPTPAIAPLSLFPRTETDLRAREPLRPITNTTPDQRQIKGSPRVPSPRELSPRGPSPRRELPKDPIVPPLHRAGSDRDIPALAPLHKVPPVLLTRRALQPSPRSEAVPTTLATVRTPLVPPSPPPAQAQAEDDELQQLHHNLSVLGTGKAKYGRARSAASNVWITEYADFTLKYGLAYKLSWGHIGALFNDGTKMIWDPDSGRVEYFYRNRDKQRDALPRSARAREELTVCTVESYPEDLKKKITLITYFKNYFAKYKGRRGTYEVIVANPNTNEHCKPVVTASPEGQLVFVKQWNKQAQGTAFRLSNRGFQTSFPDGSCLLLSNEERFLTYTNATGVAEVFDMEARFRPDIAERLEFAQRVLQQYFIAHPK